jgi:hypothetical protein
MAGQHLAVGVDVDALARSLIQEHGQIFQIMTGNEDGLAFLGPQGHFGGHRVAVGAGVAAVKQLHGLQVDLAAFQAQSDQFVHAQVFEALDQGALHEFVHALVLMTENGRVVGVGGHAFESVNEDLLQGAQVFVGFQRLGDAVLLALGDQAFQARGRGERGCGGIDRDASLGLDGFAVGDGFIYEHLKTGRVEIHVGQGREHAFIDEAVHGRVGHALGPGLHRDLRESLQGVDEKILQGRYVGLLAANADLGASGSFGGLFTLIAKHEGYPPLLGGCRFR